MVRIEGDVFIAAPRERVFELVADERNEPLYNPRITRAEKITSGPIGVGTRFTAEPAGPASAAMTVEITDYSPPERVATVISSPQMHVEGTLTLTAEGAGTRLRWSWLMRLKGAARLANPLLLLIGRPWERRNWIGLKRLVEGAPEAGSIRTRFEHVVDTRGTRFAVWLYRRTRGRIASVWGRRVLVLTTTGRRTGLSRSVLLQYFVDGPDRVVVAANSGLDRPPAWYLNLTASPKAVVEVNGTRAAVVAEELPGDDARAFWPRILLAAPEYAKYPRRTSRRLPLVRLRCLERPAPAVGPAQSTAAGAAD